MRLCSRLVGILGACQRLVIMILPYQSKHPSKIVSIKTISLLNSYIILPLNSWIEIARIVISSIRESHFRNDHWFYINQSPQSMINIGWYYYRISRMFFALDIHNNNYITIKKKKIYIYSQSFGRYQLKQYMNMNCE